MRSNVVPLAVLSRLLQVIDVYNTLYQGESRSFIYSFLNSLNGNYIDIVDSMYEICGFAVLGVFIATAIMQLSVWTALILAAVIVTVRPRLCRRALALGQLNLLYLMFTQPF